MTVPNTAAPVFAASPARKNRAPIPLSWNGKPYHSLDYHMKSVFGQKVYKLAIDGGFTCPNRDGTLGQSGCIFCSAGGSGDFAASRTKRIADQIEEGKALLRNKNTGNRYVAYFQAYTNTYAPVDHLKRLYMEALNHPDIVGISIATRPDCLSEDVIGLLAGLNRSKPVWVELGLQTIHEKTAAYIRRGYPLSCFEAALDRLNAAGLDTIIHTILGLPSETPEDMLETHRYLAGKKIQGIKPQLLHVLKNTDLALDYRQKHFHVLTLEEYTDILIHCIEVLPPEVVVHRITGDGPKNLLIAPQWSGHKKYVLNYIHHEFKVRHTWQGRLFTAADLNHTYKL